MMLQSIQNSLQGLHRNQAKLQGHADNIAQSGANKTLSGEEGISLPEEMVGVLVARRGYEANLPVIRAADEMLGTLIDAFA